MYKVSLTCAKYHYIFTYTNVFEIIFIRNLYLLFFFCYLSLKINSLNIVLNYLIREDWIRHFSFRSPMRNDIPWNPTPHESLLDWYSDWWSTFVFYDFLMIIYDWDRKILSCLRKEIEKSKERSEDWDRKIKIEIGSYIKK